MGADIRFPNLGIELEHVGRNIQIFGFPIAYYGIIITIGMIIGYFVVTWTAKRTGQDTELYLDFALCAVIISVIGARIYYVIFAWDEYKNNLLQIFNLRGGGLAIYGGIIAGTLTGIVFTKVRKVSFWRMADTICVGLITGQIIGRWGNFFNREAFGGYTNNLFAMQIKKADVYQNNITKELLDQVVVADGTQYLQVHPTFLYESVWNLFVLIFLLFYMKHKKFDGEVFLFYIALYGLGRTWIEGLRTDQLLLWGTNLAVSQLFSLILVIGALGYIIIKRLSARKKS